MKSDKRTSATLYILYGQVDEQGDNQRPNGYSTTDVRQQLQRVWIVKVLVHVDDQGKVG